MARDDTPELELLREMAAKLALRAKNYRRLQAYRSGACPIPDSIARARVTRAYRMLMDFSQTNYGRLIIKSALSRLQVGGFRSGDRDVDRSIATMWQTLHMDALSRRAIDTTLTHGRCFALCWPPDSDDPEAEPTVTLEKPDTVIIKYAPNDPFRRVAALRLWTEKNVPYATLYLLDGIYKYVGRKNEPAGPDTDWRPLPTVVPNEGTGEMEKVWPLPNPLEEEGLLPAVEISTSQEIDDSGYGKAWGDYEAMTGLLDRINILEFLRLVIAFTQGFPIRAVIGARVLKDDNGRAIAPFELAADVIAQFSKSDVRIEQIEAADVKSFGEAIDHDIETLAGLSRTPAYFLRSVPIQNVSADAIRASDAPLDTRVADHKPEIAEDLEELVRTLSLLRNRPVVVPVNTELQWVNKESKSLTERADAFSKLAGGLPWQAAVELCFDVTDEEISRWMDLRAAEDLDAAMSGFPAETSPDGTQL